ncbi:MAG: sugar phosphate isomerase/epimerase family protein [Candidatus Bathyarchaeia archaeon]|nr:sugar phosphate isomerase/epimerase [Candidatus Bathyarchaeota archaeon]
MKIGCTAYSYRKPITDGRMKLEDFIKICGSYMLDGVELTGYYFESTDKSYLKRIKRLCLDYGLDIYGTATRSDFCKPSRDDRLKEVEHVKRWVDVAYILGAPTLRVFAGSIPQGYSFEEALEWVVEALKLCGSYGEEYGVVIAMENHGGITSTVEQVSRILDSVGSEWVRLTLDLGNYRIDPYREIAESLKYTVNIHAKCHKPSPIRVDEAIDYPRIIPLLREHGYNGYLSIEYEGIAPAEEAVPIVVNGLRRLLGRVE